MGVACADFDRDSYCDIFVTHFYHAKNTLYRNLGSLSFVDDSFHSRTAACSHESLGFGTIPLDFDRDGAFDLFVANGHVLGARQSPSAMRPQLLHNDGQGRFFDVSHGAGSYFDELMLGRGVAGGDFDNDGDVDIAVTHLDRPVALLQNDTPASGHFIGFDLRTWDRVPAVGGRVVVHRPAEPHLTQPIQAGGSYLSSPDARLLFGLGDSTDPVNIEIRWADGSIDRWQGLSIDRYWRVFPGQPPQAYGRPIEDPER